MTTGAGLDRAISRDADGEQSDAGAPFDAAQRARRWSSVHRLRQFQFFGLPLIGIWRECRRMADPIPEVFNGQQLSVRRWAAMESARKAADGLPVERINASGELETVRVPDYDRHVRALGGPAVPRIQMRMSMWRARDGVIGRYGDVAGAVARGVRASVYAPVARDGRVLRRVAVGDVARVVSREHIWTIQPKSERRSDLGANLGAEGGFASPWTRVNNCTPLPDGRAGDPGGDTSRRSFFERRRA
ncbi:hypothetical protein [Sinimarinibacterium sp. NLF-5-8]|uniref:hypothetical protein n=1 Tax=Sinimarinibacterium sp. NLF-5-8 TaxID=2698684 RepID=UPI00137C3037|nr:hypothetical protein [Sinimarinibacterium sp. NLF-5-8]QHS09555.1 hypothetical protein GT972_04860 [Sinimarinibacterium sp. NLF-5-8]